jgi:hypothetical protein
MNMIFLNCAATIAVLPRLRHKLKALLPAETCISRRPTAPVTVRCLRLPIWRCFGCRSRWRLSPSMSSHNSRVPLHPYSGRTCRGLAGAGLPLEQVKRRDARDFCG